VFDPRSPRVWLGILWSVFQLYTAYAGLYDLLIQLPVHVAFAIALGFLTDPTPESPEQAEALRRRRPRRWLDGSMAALALLCAAYYVWHNDRLASRMAMVDDPLPMDVAVGLVFVVLLLWTSWRHTGPALVILSLAFVAYAFVGPWLPGFVSHGGETPMKMIDQQLFTTQGIFGIPTIVSATFIYLFVIFGNVMAYGGLLRFFTDGSLAVAGSSRGGAGKVAVLASGLTGTVNGSATANAVSTGAFTIPLMIRAGYRREFAAGVEACSSMGGQLAPPVMGAAAFIMAETLQMSYADIAIAATIPGVLYFIALGAMVHFEAVRRGLPVTPRHELPRFVAVLKRDGHMLLAPALLVWFLFSGRSAMYAGFWSLAAAFVLSWIRRDTRIGLQKSLATMIDSAQAAMPVALACATVGIVVGVVSTTGLGLKLATGIVGLAGGSLFMTLVLSMVAALVLGTGLPTSATYIMTSIMAAPALELLGVPKLVAHFFVFYFGILADLTPPTAIATYATASIAGADVWKTQMLGTMLSLSGFVIPFAYVYDPALLLIDASVAHIAYRTLTATAGVIMLSAALIGYLRGPCRLWERAVLTAGSVLLIFPGVWTDALGAACLTVVWWSQRGARPPAPVAVVSVAGERK
jgi:TRAP transporter 4TM/12TM fusion protein